MPVSDILFGDVVFQRAPPLSISEGSEQYGKGENEKKTNDSANDDSQRRYGKSSLLIVRKGAYLGGRRTKSYTIYKTVSGN